MTFPAALERSTLDHANPAYRPDRMQLYDALYQGGTAAEAIADKILIKRKIEQSRPDMFADRKARSAYIPHGAILDVMVAAVFLDEPRFEGTEYFEGLNQDCDGSGLDLAALMRQVLLETLLHGDRPGAYLAIDFDEESGDYTKPATLDARWKLLPANLVVDWGADWVKVKTSRLERASPIDEGVNVTRWFFVTATEVAVYEQRQDDQGKDVPRVSLTAHSFGRCPVFRIRMSHAGMWAMDRLAPIFRAIYNRNSALAYALDMQSFAQAVLNRDGDTKDLICSETFAIKLRPGESFGYASTSSAIFQPSFDDLVRLSDEVKAAVHAMALEAATKTQSPRLGAFSAKLQATPAEALLLSFAAPVRDVFETAARAVAEYRHEPAPTLSGFARFSADLNDLTLAIGQGGDPGAVSDQVAGKSGAPAKEKRRQVGATSNGDVG